MSFTDDSCEEEDTCGLRRMFWWSNRRKTDYAMVTNHCMAPFYQTQSRQICGALLLYLARACSWPTSTTFLDVCFHRAASLRTTLCNTESSRHHRTVRFSNNTLISCRIGKRSGSWSSLPSEVLRISNKRKKHEASYTVQGHPPTLTKKAKYTSAPSWPWTYHGTPTSTWLQEKQTTPWHS